MVVDGLATNPVVPARVGKIRVRVRMTDWNRVEKLRSKGATWAEVALDRKVRFVAPPGSDPSRAIKTLYFRQRSQAGPAPTASAGSTSGKGTRGPVGQLGRHRALILAGVVVVSLVLAAYAYQGDLSGSGKPTDWVGRIAPEFTLAIANGGGTFDLNSERNQTNVLLFFNEGLSCSPCLTQMEQLDSDAAEFLAVHVMIVSITGDSLSDMSAWAMNSHVSHTVVLADPTLTVSNEYDTTGSAVSMMPGAAPGHTFLLVSEKGIVLWRADYGPSDMSVPDSEILSSVDSALGG